VNRVLDFVNYFVFPAEHTKFQKFDLLLSSHERVGRHLQTLNFWEALISTHWSYQ
jgi:hypothetical protein